MAKIKVTPDMVAAALRDTDWGAQDKLTDREIESQVAANPDAAPVHSEADIKAAKIALVQRP